MRRNGEDKVCICGATFHVSLSRTADGKGKFCSKKCQYENAHRPSGLKYEVKIVNKTWFKKGEHPNPETEIKKGERFSITTEFTKGFTPWIKGRKHPISGELHHNWRGGVTPINERIRHSPEYFAWRKSVYERDKYTCQWCGDVGVFLHADHIKPFAYFPRLRFEVSNGRTLCVPCHKLTETYGYKAKKLQYES